MKKKKYSHLIQFERDRIEAMLNAGHKQKDIAEVLRRDPGTLSRELKRNNFERDGKEKSKGEYGATLAGQKANYRRRCAKYQGKKINKNAELKNYIVEKLKEGWSPDEISGTMKREQKLFYASKNLIYEWLYSSWGQRYCKYLKSKRYNPKKRKKEKTKKSLIPNRIGIEMRPEEINNNEEYGHCEMDTIVSGKKTGSKEALVVVYQRKAKYVGIKKIKSLEPKKFNEAILKIQERQKIKSLTGDNGIENRLYEFLGIDTYFCDPYSSWQKGGVENVNGMIRKYIPKGSDIGKYSDEYIQKVEDILNNKPRKSLGYMSAIKVMKDNNLLLKNKKSRREKIALRG